MINSNFQNILVRLKSFRKERNWKKFHDPKSVSEAIVIEASELLELFLWKEKKELKKELLKQNYREEIADEIADTMNFLILLADDLKIDLEEAIENKIAKNKKKYPIEKAKGKSTKYNKLEI